MAEKKDITIVGRENCTGCGACKAVCPKSAIVFEPDAEGFSSPRIRDELCIRCGLCAKTCPVLEPPVRQHIRNAYAAQILDKDALKESTSGGLFTVFSREIFRRGGLVYGCVWDKDYNAVIVKAENEAEIAPMRGSKYVWSWAGDAYPEIKIALEAGRTVLFTGLPCQAAGLRNYLGKDYDGLYIVDCLCSGVPSPLALQSWIQTILPKGVKKSDLNLKFRDKHPLGLGVHITYTGQKHKNFPAGEHIRNPYYYSFYIRLIDRCSCYHCNYGTDQRVSDLTMCDYWGIKNYHPDLDVASGFSGLMVNSEKGWALLESVKDDLMLIPTDYRNIGKANNLSYDGKKRIIYRPPYREEFFKVLKQDGWKAAENKYLYNLPRMKLWLKTWIPSKYVSAVKKVLGRK